MNTSVAYSQRFGKSEAFNRDLSNTETIQVSSALSFASALLLGVRTAIAVPSILACIALSILWAMSSLRIPHVRFFYDAFRYLCIFHRNRIRGNHIDRKQWARGLAKRRETVLPMHLAGHFPDLERTWRGGDKGLGPRLVGNDNVSLLDRRCQTNRCEPQLVAPRCRCHFRIPCHIQLSR